MNIEAYSYTVLSAILGIIIVFAFLGFLCVFMWIIKKLFDGKVVSTDKDSSLSIKVSESEAADDIDWISAAIAVYLEKEDFPRSAIPWQPREDEKSDPWVSVPRVQKILSGV